MIDNENAELGAEPTIPLADALRDAAPKRRRRNAAPPAPKAKTPGGLRGFALGSSSPKPKTKKNAKAKAKAKPEKKAPPPEPVKTPAQLARAAKRAGIQKLDHAHGEFGAIELTDFLKGRLVGDGRWDDKLRRHVDPPAVPYEVTVTDAREAGELLAAELQLEARKRAFTQRILAELDAADAAEVKGTST